MILDNVQVVDADRRAKPNEGLVTNSIKERKESYENLIMRTRKLIAQRDAAIYGLEEKVANDIEANVPVKKIEKSHLDEAIKIGNLDKEIYALGIMQGPIEKIGDGRRAIRLIDKMIKNVKSNSQTIYNELDGKEENKPYTDENVEKVVEQIKNEVLTEGVVQNSDVNVQQIAADHQDEVKENIESAIENEKTLENADIDAVVTNSLNNVVNGDNGALVDAQEEVSPEEIIDDQTIQDIVNEKMKAFADNSPLVDINNGKLNNIVNPTSEPIIVEEKEPYIEEYEYKPMTDDEIEKSRRKMELDNFALRDEIVVAPERENASEYVDDKENEESSIVIEKVDAAEPVSAIASEDFKKKAEEDYMKKLEELSDEQLDEELSTMFRRKELLEEEANNVEADKEKEIRINSEVAAEEEEIEKREAEITKEEAAVIKENEELQEEDARKKAEVRRKKIAKLFSVKESIDATASKLESDMAIIADVNKNTEARRENISNKNRNIETKLENISNMTRGNEELKESINRSREISVMLSENNVIEETKQKTM